MATFNIDSLEKKGITLSYVNDGNDNFSAKHIEKLKDDNKKYIMISYNEFSDMFLSTKYNYFIHSLNIDESDDSYVIHLDYNYIENRNGIHLFAPSNNTFRVKKRVYDGSKLQSMLNQEKHGLDLIHDDLIAHMEIEKIKINDLENRIKPSVEKVLDDYFDIEKEIDFDNYDISKEEFIDYLKRNPLYIRSYIMQYSYKISFALKASASCALLFSIEILITLVTKNISLFSYISYVLFLISLTSGALSIAMIERGLSELKNSDGKVVSFPIRRRKKESKIS